MLLRPKKINSIINVDLETLTITTAKKTIRELNILKTGINRKIRKQPYLEVEEKIKAEEGEVEAREIVEITNY